MKKRWETFGDLLMLMGGNGASQLINAVSFSIIYAQFSEAAAAQYFLVLSQSAVVVTLVTLRMEQAALVDVENARDILRLSVLFALLFNFAVFWGHLLVFTDNFWVSIQFGLLNLLWTLFGVGLVKLILKKQVRRLAVVRLLQSTSFLFMVALSGSFGFPISLLLALAVSYLLPVAFLLTISDFQFFKLKFSDACSLLKRHRAYILFDMPSGFVSNLTMAIPLWAVAGNYGDAVTATFGFATRLIYAPFNLISSAIREKYKSDSIGLLAVQFNSLHRSYEWALALATLPIALIGVAVIWLLSYEATQFFIFSALLTISLFRFNVSPVSFIIYVKERIKLDLWLHLGLLAVLIALWQSAKFLTFEIFLMVFVFTMAFFYSVYKMVIRWLLRLSGYGEVKS